MLFGLFTDEENFNPRSPHGERRLALVTLLARHVFQSTLPARGATGKQYATVSYVDISIHAPRTGSDEGVENGSRPRYISIHAPRTGSDAIESAIDAAKEIISIHAPRTGSDATPHIRF